jgi:tetratricopeptide (TPR) repeat protein
VDWIWQTLAQALKLHQEGAYDRAEALYRQVLAADPRNADANHLLGVLAHHTGNNELAVQLIQRALMFQPAAALFHFNLGLAQDALGRRNHATDFPTPRGFFSKSQDPSSRLKGWGNACYWQKYQVAGGN